jgi:FHS family L-fucose permease-like MFS transporter
MMARPNTAFVTVTSLFFAWGFVTATLDPLVPLVRSVFTLSYSESLLTQSAFFLSYGIVSLPASSFVARRGSAASIVAALLCMVAGCLMMPLATSLRAYWLVLLALFVLGSGITLLQVAANPLAAALGAPEQSHLRLTLSQAFNSLGTVLAPWIGSMVMLRGGVFAGGEQEAARVESLKSVDLTFLAVAAFIALLAFAIWRLRQVIAAAAPEPDGAGHSPFEALRSRWAVAGAAGIFLYVGAEVSIASVMINFLMQPHILGVSAEEAGRLLGHFYWGGAMVGRFIGSWLLARVRAGRVLCAAAAVAALLCIGVTQSGGMAAAVAALAVGLFNSVMFPTIFTLTLERSSAAPASTSGLLCVAIVGGAALPRLVGLVADAAGLGPTFFIPALAYLCIALFAAATLRKAAESGR